MTEVPKFYVQQPRARGSVSVGVRSGPRGTELARLRHEGSLRAMFPRGDSSDLTIVLTNTSGGVTGGDKFRVAVSVEQDSTLTLTTQTAERAYKAQPGEVGRVSTQLSVAAGARINWLPQETILFQKCAMKRRLDIDLDKDGSALLVEPLVFGRVAMGEVLTQAHFADRIQVTRAGKCIYLDRVVLDGDLAQQMARPAIGDGAGAMATLVFVHDSAEAMVDALRSVLPETGGASLVKDGVLVARLLAPDSFLLRKSLIPAIKLLNNDDLPRPWMI